MIGTEVTTHLLDEGDCDDEDERGDGCEGGDGGPGRGGQRV